MGKMKREEVDKNDNIQFILKSGGRLRQHHIPSNRARNLMQEEKNEH
jgi:hypothetical protein